MGKGGCVQARSQSARRVVARAVSAVASVCAVGAFVTGALASSATAQSLAVQPGLFEVATGSPSRIQVSYRLVDPDIISFSLLGGAFCTEVVPAPGATPGAGPIVGGGGVAALDFDDVDCVAPFASAPAGAAGATRVTDSVSIARSVAQIAQRRLAASGAPVFFFVRRVALFGEVNGEVGVGVALRLTGAAAGPLTINRSDLFGRPDPGTRLTGGAIRSGDQQIAVLSAGNLENGQVFAELDVTGTGRLSGQWEALFPGRAPLTVVDLLPPTGLSAAEFQARRNLVVVRRANGAPHRFNIQVRSTDRRILLPGPRYSELPRLQDGKYTLVFRLDRQFEVLSAAPFDTLDYFVQPDVATANDVDPVLIERPGQATSLLTWRAPRLASRLNVLWATRRGPGNDACDGVARLQSGRAEVPNRCLGSDKRVTLRVADLFGNALGAVQTVKLGP